MEHLRVVFELFCEFNLKLKPSKCSFFQSEIVYLVHHTSCIGILPSKDNVHMVEEFLMPLTGHYRHFIKGFAHITWTLYDVLGKEVRMGPVQLPLEAWEAVRILKDKIQTACVGVPRL